MAKRHQVIDVNAILEHRVEVVGHRAIMPFLPRPLEVLPRHAVPTLVRHEAPSWKLRPHAEVGQTFDHVDGLDLGRVLPERIAATGCPKAKRSRAAELTGMVLLWPTLLVTNVYVIAEHTLLSQPTYAARKRGHKLLVHRFGIIW
jgi:hypothetical protein